MEVLSHIASLDELDQRSSEKNQAHNWTHVESPDITQIERLINAGQNIVLSDHSFQIYAQQMAGMELGEISENYLLLHMPSYPFELTRHAVTMISKKSYIPYLNNISVVDSRHHLYVKQEKVQQSFTDRTGLIPYLGTPVDAEGNIGIELMVGCLDSGSLVFGMQSPLAPETTSTGWFIRNIIDNFMNTYENSPNNPRSLR